MIDHPSSLNLLPLIDSTWHQVCVGSPRSYMHAEAVPTTSVGIGMLGERGSLAGRVFRLLIRHIVV
jgi:hypothetical protein